MKSTAVSDGWVEVVPTKTMNAERKEERKKERKKEREPETADKRASNKSLVTPPLQRRNHCACGV